MKNTIISAAVLAALSSLAGPMLSRIPRMEMNLDATNDFLPGLGMGKHGNRIGPGRPSLRKNWPGHRNREWVPMGGAQECARRRRQMGRQEHAE